jgi:hypothetical protein
MPQAFSHSRKPRRSTGRKPTEEIKKTFFADPATVATNIGLKTKSKPASSDQCGSLAITPIDSWRGKENEALSGGCWGSTTEFMVVIGINDAGGSILSGEIANLPSLNRLHISTGDFIIPED